MIPDLHPEELLDKATRGELTPAERTVLDAHLAECVVCRFAQTATDDFARLPMPQLDVDHLVTNALTARVSSSLRPRPRRMGAWLAAAVALMAMGSFAAVGQWTGVLPRLLSALNAPSTKPQVAKAAGAPAAPRSSVTAAEPVSNAPELPRPASRVSSTASASPAPVVTSKGHYRSSGLGSKRVAPRGPKTPAEAFDAATRARLEGDRALAMARYREIIASWPRSHEAHQTRATLGRMLLDHGDASAALEQLDGYLDGSEGTLREDVLAARAQALMRLGRVNDEGRAWQALLDQYPESIHAPRAHARLEALPASP